MYVDERLQYMDYSPGTTFSFKIEKTQIHCLSQRQIVIVVQHKILLDESSPEVNPLLMVVVVAGQQAVQFVLDLLELSNANDMVNLRY